MKAQKNKKTFFFGFFNKRERWGLSWKGWLISSFVTISFFMFVLKNLYSFLAPTKRVDTKTLVVEGWLQDDDAMELAAKEFRDGKYDHIFVLGSPIIKRKFFAKHQSTAELGYETLLKMGIPAQNITPVTGPISLTNRTYHCALALKKYFAVKKIEISSLNLLSGGAHSRRSHLLFNLAFDNKLKVGIIAAETAEIDNTHAWWSSSGGFRTVTSELIAYLYSLFFKYAKLGSL